MSLIPLKRNRVKGYRLTYNGIGIYEALKKEMFNKTHTPDVWIEFKNSPECNWLPLPPTYGNNNASYFTEAGYNKFMELTMPIVNEYISAEDIKTEVSKVPANAIVYEDEYQFVIDTNKQEWDHDNHPYSFDNPNIYMRPATENDVDNMYAWEMESIDKSLQEDPKVQQLIREDCYQSIKDTQMIMDQDKTIGMFTACMIDNGEWRYIGEIYLTPEYRGQHIGSTILKNEIANYDRIRLQVAYDNENALRLYKSLGFKIVKENKEAKLYIMEYDKSSTIQEAVLKTKERNALKNGDFALVYKDKNGRLIRKYPVHDESHVVAASKMFPRGVPDEYKERVARRILREAKSYKLDTSGWKSIHKALEKNVSESYVERKNFIMKEQITKILEAYNSGVLTQEEASEKIEAIQEEYAPKNDAEKNKVKEMKENWDEDYFQKIEKLATDEKSKMNPKNQRDYQALYEELKKYRPKKVTESTTMNNLRVKQDKIMESFKMGIINATEGMRLIERVMMEADYIAEEEDTAYEGDDDNEPEDITPEDTDGDTVDSDDTNIDALADYINSLSDDEKTALMSKLSGSDEPTDDDANGNEEVPTDDTTEGEPTTEETVDPASVSDASLNDANASLDDMEV